MKSIIRFFGTCRIRVEYSVNHAKLKVKNVAKGKWISPRKVTIFLQYSIFKEKRVETV